MWRNSTRHFYKPYLKKILYRAKWAMSLYKIKTLDEQNRHEQTK